MTIETRHPALARYLCPARVLAVALAAAWAPYAPAQSESPAKSESDVTVYGGYRFGGSLRIMRRSSRAISGSAGWCPSAGTPGFESKPAATEF